MKPKYVFIDRSTGKWRGQFNYKNRVYQTKRYAPPYALGPVNADLFDLRRSNVRTEP
jgi:hypothetical protein